jgi:Uncharacterized protein conserved in bacteria (DUF2252)
MGGRKDEIPGGDAAAEPLLFSEAPDLRAWIGGSETRFSEEERRARGKSARKEIPRSSHGSLGPRATRRDPIALLEEHDRTRDPELVALKHGRMLLSPLAYFRGSAVTMASDLADTPRSGFTAQLTGDAALSNFGVFASLDAGAVFDVANFDETATGPWEWDLKRLAASLEISGRDNDFSNGDRKEIVRSAVRAYRDTLAEFSAMSMMQVWHSSLDAERLLRRFRGLLHVDKTPRAWQMIEKGRAHDAYKVADLLRSATDDPKIESDPPVVVRLEDLGGAVGSYADPRSLKETIRSYVHTLQPELRYLLAQYRIADAARTAVGIAGVGVDAWIVLLVDGATGSPLLLEVKQAEASVVERFWSKRALSNHGQRVVYGQRLIQTGDDIFLGWEPDVHGDRGRDYYVRRLRNWIESSEAEGMTPASTELWARMCSWTLARAHARSADRIAISSYLGRSDVFDRAIGAYAWAYADQNERDYETFQKAVRKGRLLAETIG